MNEILGRQNVGDEWGKYSCVIFDLSQGVGVSVGHQEYGQHAGKHGHPVEPEFVNCSFQKLVFDVKIGAPISNDAGGLPKVQYGMVRRLKQMLVTPGSQKFAYSDSDGVDVSLTWLCSPEHLSGRVMHTQVLYSVSREQPVPDVTKSSL